MECAQINIVGGTGTSVPAKTYSIPGIYKANDPGILINIYSMTTSSKYTIPGPPVFTCNGSGGSSLGGNAVAETPTTLMTVEVPAATSSPASSASAEEPPSWY